MSATSHRRRAYAHVLVHIESIRLVREVVLADNLPRFRFGILFLTAERSAPAFECGTGAHVLFVIVMGDPRPEPCHNVLLFGPLALLLDLSFGQLAYIYAFPCLTELAKLDKI